MTVGEFQKGGRAARAVAKLKEVQSQSPIYELSMDPFVTCRSDQSSFRSAEAIGFEITAYPAGL